MKKIEKMIRENKKYEFEVQKFLDISSNIKDEELKTKVVAQMIKCQQRILEIVVKK